MVILKISILFAILINLTFAVTKLPTLETKQSIQNIRFISNDGKYTYYQRNDGTFLFATNYKVTEVIKKSENTQYNIISSIYKKNLVLTADESFHSNFSITKDKQIYLLKFGSEKTTLIGNGVQPQLHLEDKWVSFYIPKKKIIKFMNTGSDSLTFDIKLNAGKNPYFIPEVMMIDRNTIYFTDINENGVFGILNYDKVSKKVSIFHKNYDFTEKFEFCRNKNHFYIMTKSLLNKNLGTTILKYDNKQIKDFSKGEILYESKLNDFGNITCFHEDKLYFVKQTASKPTSVTEAASIEIETKKVKIESSLKNVTQIITMDGKILIPYREKYYLIRGENNLGEDIFNTNN